MTYDDDEQTSLLFTCSCGAALSTTDNPQQCDCGREYGEGGRAIWPDEPLRDLQYT